MKKAVIQIGTCYATKQHGEVIALETNREKIFCRIVATGEIDLIGYRKLQPALEPQTKPARDEAERAVKVMARPRLDRHPMDREGTAAAGSIARQKARAGLLCGQREEWFAGRGLRAR